MVRSVSSRGPRGGPDLAARVAPRSPVARVARSLVTDTVRGLSLRAERAERHERLRVVRHTLCLLNSYAS